MVGLGVSAGAAVLPDCWTVFGLTVKKIFVIVQELAGQNLKDTEHAVVELHCSVAGSGQNSETQGHVLGHLQQDLLPSKNSNCTLVIE